MTYHTSDEGVIKKSSSTITTLAARYSLYDRPALEINQSKIVLPEKMETVLKKVNFHWLNQDHFLPNQNCYQVHMTKYNFNPYSYNVEDINMVCLYI